MPPETWREARRVMARLVARAYCRDHCPELLGAEQVGQISGPSPAARADAGAPPARGGGPEAMELEQSDGATGSETG
jgi:hypothetical protein